MPTNVPVFDPFTFPSLTKSTIGFDSIIKRLQDVTESFPKIPTYPPYNIKQTGENKYVIEMAVAGFGKQDLELELQEGVLTVRGQVSADDDGKEYLFKGIADRAFTRKFTLADTIEIKNADLINGMLKIWLERFIPEEKRPIKIDIGEESVSSKQFLTENSKNIT
jgi:molecular chaperone IbpA